MNNMLKFGTSGLRDTVENMSDRECYINTRGFINFLKERGEIGKEDPSLAIGGDLRNSTPRIMAAVARAVQDSGCHVISCGKLPSPALAYFAMKKGVPSIMVTGSHIPEDRNGIKFTKISGEVLKSDEQDILKNVAAVRNDEMKRPEVQKIFDEKGMFNSAENEPENAAEGEALSLYVRRYTDVFPKDSLSGLKIVFYQHSAVGRDIIGGILEGLGAEVIRVARSEKFVPVDTEKISTETLAFLKEWAGEYKPFALFSTDGDSDRPLVADETGTFIPGDKLGALVSLYLNPDFAAVPVSANDAVMSALAERGIKVMQTKIGSPYVVKAMIDEMSSSPSSKVVSWESNGGFLLGSDWQMPEGVLGALPTRDAVLPVIALLLLAKKAGIQVSEVIKNDLPARYTDAGVADNSTPGCEKYTTDIGKGIIETFSLRREDIQEVDFSEGNVNVEVSDITESEQTELKDIKNKLKTYFSGSRGFADVKSINFVDGIRVVFEGGDVVHMRPSGNAPEFRLYATADTRERARDIVSFKDEIIPLIVRDVSARSLRSVGAMASSDNGLDDEIISAVKAGIPFSIEPYREPKVWGVDGVGEFWYGSGDGEKSSTAVVAGHKVLMGELVSSLAKDLLGEKVIEKFGVMSPLVKILTPKGRLSVQFHEAKNELWIVTSCDSSLAGGKNWIILGFSSESVEKYGKDVTNQYGNALVVYGEKLNELIDTIEAGGEYPKELLRRTKNVLSAAEELRDDNQDVAEAEKSFLDAKIDVEYFYCYRDVVPGDVIPVSSGTLHALGPGVFVIEPQISGSTQSLEDGMTYPVRYYFPGYQRQDALKVLDIDRVDEMNPEVTADVLPESIDKGDGYVVDRLPGNFAEKGLEVHRIILETHSVVKRHNNSSMHSMVASKGEAFVFFEGKEYSVPQASPGGDMLIVPASCTEYEIKTDLGAEIIDTFTPVCDC